MSGNGAEGPPQLPPPQEARKVGRLSYFRAGEIKPDFWTPGLVDGVLETKALTVMYGPSGSGKTAVAVDLACRVAAGMEWRGHPTQQGLVVYVAAENAESTRRRVWAWMQVRRSGAIPLIAVHTALQAGPDTAKELAALVAVEEQEFEKPACMIVFDTLARTIRGDENAAKDMGEYVAVMDQLRDLIHGHVLVVHHTGKDESRGARGSSALKAAADHELEVSKEKGSRVGSVTLTKVREGDLEGKRYGFELMPRILGVNRNGLQKTTVVVEEAEAPAVEERGKALVDDAAILGFVSSYQGPLTEKALKGGVRLREKDSTNRQAWYEAKRRGTFSVDAEGFVYA